MQAEGRATFSASAHEGSPGYDTSVPQVTAASPTNLGFLSYSWMDRNARGRRGCPANFVRLALHAPTTLGVWAKRRRQRNEWQTSVAPASSAFCSSSLKMEASREYPFSRRLMRVVSCSCCPNVSQNSSWTHRSRKSVVLGPWLRSVVGEGFRFSVSFSNALCLSTVKQNEFQET